LPPGWGGSRYDDCFSDHVRRGTPPQGCFAKVPGYIYEVRRLHHEVAKRTIPFSNEVELMSSTNSPFSPLPIVFFDPDSEAAHTSLAEALQSLPPGALVLGLALKVERQDGAEKLVNWEFVAPEILKSLALALPSDLTGELYPSKE